MLEFVATSTGPESLAALLGGLRFDDIDLSPLAPEMARILDDENRRARLEGTDATGAILLDVLDPLDPRRGGNGPPLAPRYEQSRVIANHFVREEDSGPGRLVLVDGWSGIPWLAAHAAGSGHLRVRDILDIDPETQAYIGDVLADYVTRRVAERLESI